MKGPEVLSIIVDAIHDGCGDENCGAEVMHTEDAQRILFALSDEGVIKVDE